jgi:uncharacterized protein DUF2750
MTYDLSDEEREGVLAADDDKQYAYFVKKVADWGEAFVLAKDDTWPSVVDDDGTSYLPVWPHPGFAEESVSGEWAQHEITPVEVHKFLDVLENLHAKGDGLAMFRQPDRGFIGVKPGELLEDLTGELDRIE